MEYFENLCKDLYIEEKDGTNDLRYTVKLDTEHFYKSLRKTSDVAGDYICLSPSVCKIGKTGGIIN